MEGTCEWKSGSVTERDSVEVSGQENQCGWEKDVWSGRQGQNDKGREWVSEWVIQGEGKFVSWRASGWEIVWVHYKRQKGCRWFSKKIRVNKIIFSQRYYETLNYSVVSRRVVICVVPCFSKNGRSLITHDFTWHHLSQTAWPWQCKHYEPSKCLERLTRRHRVTFQKKNSF